MQLRGHRKARGWGTRSMLVSYITSFIPHGGAYVVGTTIILILQMRKLRHKEVNQLAQGDTTSMWDR